MSGRSRIASTLALLLVALVAFAPGAAASPNPDPETIARWQPCEPDTGVTVIVSFDRLGDGKVHVGCALGNQTSGVAALQNAGFELTGTLPYGLGFICRIDGFPTAAEEDCLTTPGGDEYWIYLKGKPGGRWMYSGVGAGGVGNEPRINSVEGWAFQGMPVEPMDSRGPSSFELPPAQESSVIPARAARQWLLGATLEAVEKIGSGELNADMGMLVAQVNALGAAGVEPGELAPFAAELDGPAAGWATKALAFGVDPSSPDVLRYAYPDRLARLTLAAAATGLDPTDLAGYDLRAGLVELVDPVTGSPREMWPPITVAYFLNGDVGVAGQMLEALARSGPLPPRASTLIAWLLAQQDPETGSFVPAGEPEATLPHVAAIRGLAAAREAGVDGLDEALAEAGAHLEDLQREDGGVKQGSVVLGDRYEPSIASTAAAAVGLELSGRHEAAVRAAKWVSRYQVTEEYAGTPDPVSGEPPPAWGIVGAFVEDEDDLRSALLYGVVRNQSYLYGGIETPTALALEALTAAGPYGPLVAGFDQDSLWFDPQTLGSEGPPRAATLTNEDERPVAVEAIELLGEAAADFSLDSSACAGRALAPGEGCELRARFVPTATALRQALVRVTAAGGQAFELGLGGTGTAAPETPDADPDPGPPVSDPDPPASDPDPPASLAPPLPPGAAPAPRPRVAPTIAARAAARIGNGGRLVRVATLSCPTGGPPCSVVRPRRVSVLIAGRRRLARVLAPPALAPGQSAPLRVLLPKGTRLGANAVTVRVSVSIFHDDEVATRNVEARVAEMEKR